ncbi:DUF3039 domain-containing protein [Bombiscardovia coagulans]|uniref:DUF3039 domain-containing protein n=1 Tax=Bombiscardovia coagulans TaxID=686666 RepID=A0A261EUW9_9BIFI|nr:DUF3039 domain-containing protein [Bombiscardovia coagulans]OZG50660.1 hypothetical protein BOCO_0260 [Bombiscardovia coagulans]
MSKIVDIWTDDESTSPFSSPDEGGNTAVLERPETKEEAQQSDNGDADRYSHYVSKEKIAESKLTGRPVVALCGKVWVPRHDPSQYPVCPDCKRIYEEMKNAGF